jgi:alpha-glucosidase
MLPAPNSWLAAVHHDGSAVYVSNPYPRLGERVRLRLRVGSAAPLRRAFLRTTPDGEQAFAQLQPAENLPPARWLGVELVVSEPKVHYRFVLEADDGVWFYNAAGIEDHDPPDAFDFQLLADFDPPGWVAGSVFYQIFPDRFANGDPSTNPQPGEYEYKGRRPRTYAWEQPPDPGQAFPFVFYGGDLPGIQTRLDYLESLGVNALYLNPVFTAYSNHKYDVVDYEHVDPHFGGDAALASLGQALRRRGMRYLLDIVPNHAGYFHPWFQAARADPRAPEANFFTFTCHPDEYASWLGVWTLPKLDYRSAELRRRMYAGRSSVFRRWLRRPYLADGWRVDVANMLARQGPTQLGAQIAQGMRRAVKSARPDAYLIGENFFDAAAQLQGDQWDGAMNYSGFTKPLWHWLRGYQQGAHGLPEMIRSPQPFPTAGLEAQWRQRRALIPWAVQLLQYNLLDSHDVPRIRTIAGGDDGLHRMAAAALLTYPGAPGLYYGDEIGMQDDPQLGSRGCMIWDDARWDHALLEYHCRLIALRRSSAALQTGGFQALEVGADSLAYQREAPGERVIVVLQRRAMPGRSLPAAHGGVPDGRRFVEQISGLEARVTGGALPLPTAPAGAMVWVEE